MAALSSVRFAPGSVRISDVDDDGDDGSVRAMDPTGDNNVFWSPSSSFTQYNPQEAPQRGLSPPGHYSAGSSSSIYQPFISSPEVKIPSVWNPHQQQQHHLETKTPILSYLSSPPLIPVPSYTIPSSSSTTSSSSSFTVPPTPSPPHPQPNPSILTPLSTFSLSSPSTTTTTTTPKQPFTIPVVEATPFPSQQQYYHQQQQQTNQFNMPKKQLPRRDYIPDEEETYEDDDDISSTSSSTFPSFDGFVENDKKKPSQSRRTKRQWRGYHPTFASSSSSSTTSTVSPPGGISDTRSSGLVAHYGSDLFNIMRAYASCAPHLGQGSTDPADLFDPDMDMKQLVQRLATRGVTLNHETHMIHPPTEDSVTAVLSMIEKDKKLAISQRMSYAYNDLRTSFSIRQAYPNGFTSFLTLTKSSEQFSRFVKYTIASDYKNKALEKRLYVGKENEKAARKMEQETIEYFVNIACSQQYQYY